MTQNDKGDMWIYIKGRTDPVALVGRDDVMSVLRSF